MNESTGRAIDKSVKYGAVFSEVSSPGHSVTSKVLTGFSLIRLRMLPLVLPASLLRFVLAATGVSEAEIILEAQLLRDENRYCHIPLSLFEQVQRVLPLADSVAHEIVCEETELLDEIIPRMFNVMHRAAEYSCDYVRRGHLGGSSPFLDFVCADDCSENGWRTGSPGCNRGNREGLDQGY